jgi:oligoendopeptidase F
LVEAFEAKYRGKITKLSADGLLECLQDIEALQAGFSDIALYASLSFSANMTLPQTQALNDRVNKLEAAISKQLAFYSLALGALIKGQPQLIQELALANYKHMLERVQRRVEQRFGRKKDPLLR